MRGIQPKIQTSCATCDKTIFKMAQWIRAVNYCATCLTEQSRKRINQNKARFPVGTIITGSDGYVRAYHPEHPNAPENGFVLVHRIVMESHIGRYLTSVEVVHHIDRNLTNNDISNLQLMADRGTHLAAEHVADGVKARLAATPKCPTCLKYLRTGWVTCARCAPRPMCRQCPKRIRYVYSAHGLCEVCYARQQGIKHFGVQSCLICKQEYAPKDVEQATCGNTCASILRGRNRLKPRRPCLLCGQVCTKSRNIYCSKICSDRAKRHVQTDQSVDVATKQDRG